MATITNLNDFSKDSIEIIGVHSPLVLYYKLTHNSSSLSYDPEVQCTGQSPAENTTLYEFEAIQIDYQNVGGGNYDYYFRLDLSEILKNIINAPRLENEVTSIYYYPSRLATRIDVDYFFSGLVGDAMDYYYMHGFNQVNNPDGSCLGEFGDKTRECKIPIAPGIPHLWYLWVNAAHTSVSTNRVYLDTDYRNLLAAMGKGLFQIYVPAWNEDLYDNWSGQVEEHDLFIRDDTDTPASEHARITLVALKEACEDGIVLCWLNKHGVYSYLAFDKWHKVNHSQKHVGSYDQEIYGIEDLQSRSLSRGYMEVFKKIEAVCHAIPSEYIPIIEDLFYSMDVYLYTGAIPATEHDDADWLRVLVEGEVPERKKSGTTNVRVTITLPEYFSQNR